jgi:predicted RNA-binding Zn-ribbon protein involved in translation (DUF1610 family)
MAEIDKKEKCLICDNKIYYSERHMSMQCAFCGEFFYTNSICKNRHYICDECHIKRAIESITQYCEKTTQKEAVAIAFKLMNDKWVRMHGPEHAFLVTAVLITAYKNRGYNGKWSFEATLDEAKKRAMKIPTNSCAYWGCAGEAIGSGIFASLVLKASPISVSERANANMITSRVLEQIAVYGGPRCSKRESLIAILVSSQFTEEYWKKPLSDFQGVECIFFEKNTECIKGRCPFFPKPEAGGE